MSNGIIILSTSQSSVRRSDSSCGIFVL